MKKIFSLLLISIFALSLVGCGVKEKKDNGGQKVSDALKFKEEYESLNGKLNNSDLEHRTLKIAEDNPFVYITPEELIEKIQNKETFYVYFGSNYCPWCRSVIEEAIKSAKDNDVTEIYYIDIWDGDHVEILRDTYELDSNNKPVLKSEGASEYQKILELFDNVLGDYTLTTSKGKKVSVGEKRITAPNFVYVLEGSAKTLVTGISEHQSNSREELTEEMLKDEEKIFQEFFNSETCSALGDC